MRIKKRSITEELYKKVSINDLILFAVYSLSLQNKKCNFERLTKECFILFPRTFSFSHITKWPDSRKLDRPLRLLRRKKLITTSFSLTKSGKKIAEDIFKEFRQSKLI